MTSHRLSLALTLLFLTSAVVRSESTTNPISWNTHYGNAKRVAEATKRPLLVVIEDSKRVGTQIDEKSLDGTSREKLRKQDFQLVRVDANTDYGKRVAEAFGVRSFPYTAVTDGGSKRIVFRKTGPMSKSDWRLALAKSAKSVIPVESATSTAKQITSQPASSQEIVYEQPIQRSYPVVTQPMEVRPVIGTEYFVPNGFYQPAEQCFT